MRIEIKKKGNVVAWVSLINTKINGHIEIEYIKVEKEFPDDPKIFYRAQPHQEYRLCKKYNLEAGLYREGSQDCQHR